MRTISAGSSTASQSICVLLCSLSTSAAVMAAPLTSIKVSVTPNTVKTGQTVVLQNSIQSTVPLSNVSIILEVRRISANGTVNSYPVFSKTLPGQNFAVNETKVYKENFVIPPALISSPYTYVIKATNADKSTVYLEAKSNAAPHAFTVNGRPDVGYIRGINIMDLGISSQNLPGTYGTHYIKPSLASLQALKERGIEMVRIPFKWERVQPTLGEELNAQNLGYIMEVLKDANTAGLKVMLDMHNFGRYTPTGTPDRTAYPLGHAKGATPGHFADFWRRLATAVKADPKAYAALYAYDLMNEPYDLVPGAPTGYNKTAIPFEGWTPQWAATTSVAQSTRNTRPALEIKGTAVAGSGMVFRVALPSTAKALAAANGNNIQIKGFVPESTSGDVKARIWMLDAKSVPASSPVTALAKDEAFTLDFAPPAEVWANNRGVYVDFMVDNSDGFAPSVFYLDEINQGTFQGVKAPQRVWEEYAQAAVSAIRDTGDSALIHVEGYHFSSATLWPVNHPAAWIKDPLNKTVYHAHQYMDNDSSGTYKLSHEKELELAKKQGHEDLAARAISRYEKFNDWLVKHNVPGFIGEIGWPNSAVVGDSDATAWNEDAEKLFDYMDTYNMGAAVWATGSWLNANGNILNMYVLPESKRQFTPLSSAKVLEAHPGNKK